MKNKIKLKLKKILIKKIDNSKSDFIIVKTIKKKETTEQAELRKKKEEEEASKTQKDKKSKQLETSFTDLQ